MARGGSRRTRRASRMAAAPSAGSRLAVCALGVWLVSLLSLFCVPSVQAAGSLAATETLAEGSAPIRLISLNPSLTAILVRLNAGETLVGIDDYSARVVEEVEALPRVGGLFDPNLESVVALRPDRVLVVAGVDQQRFTAQLERLGVSVEIFENERLEQVLENIERLGRLVGREREARERIAKIRATEAAMARVVAGRARPGTLAVVDRSPLYLVGGGTFLDEMLEVVGAKNLARDLAPGYPRGSIEWLIAARPELLLDMTPGGVDSAAFWSRWPSLPAVAMDRVRTVEASRISLPGPDLDRALRELAEVVHGPEIGMEIDAALADAGAPSTDEPGAVAR